MKILVGISRVPDTATKIFIGADGRSIDEKGVKFIINPYDEFALEEGLRLREKFGGTVVTITVGPEASKEVIRSGLAMGADRAVLIKRDMPFDSYFVAKNIVNYAQQYQPDIILFGRQSVDYDSLSVPAMVSELLSMPLVTIVSKLNIDGNQVIAERDVVGGKEVVETTLPCVISAQKGLNEPRYPKLPDILKAKNKPIEEIEPLETIPTTEVLSMEIPLRSRKNRIVGDSETEIAEIVKLLHEEAKII
ncbi:MAG: electron transfer flavoprotein subunit beta/FixA family protein [Candidatus Kapaibacteriota bacterium]